MRKAAIAAVGKGRLTLVAVAIVGVALALVAGWNLTGGRLLVMETPSMCPRVCVGSLVADRPLQGPLHVGEPITFHPPGDPTETYTHEVYQLLPGGMIETRGIANPDRDPWVITRSNIVAEVSFTLWGLGWVLTALPMLAVGLAICVIGRAWVAERTRRTWDRAWLTALAVVPLWILHPLVRGEVLSTTADPAHRGWLRGTMVNTGILPTSFAARGGEVVSHVASTASVHVSGPLAGHGLLIVNEAVSLPWWGWLLVALGVASPLLGYLWHIWRDNEVVALAGTAGPAAGDRQAPPPEACSDFGEDGLRQVEEPRADVLAEALGLGVVAGGGECPVAEQPDDDEIEGQQVRELVTADSEAGGLRHARPESPRG